VSTKVERDRPSGDEAGALGGATKQRDPIPNVCRMLRTKTSYGVSERGAEWKRGESTTAVYWCLATMESFGADDNFCHPHACLRGRSCWESGEED
jgi:hypothetical protein